MTQLNVIHEVGDSQTESSGSDDDSEPLIDGQAAADEAVPTAAATTDTDSLAFSRPTLWYT